MRSEQRRKWQIAVIGICLAEVALFWAIGGVYFLVTMFVVVPGLLLMGYGLLHGVLAIVEKAKKDIPLRQSISREWAVGAVFALASAAAYLLGREMLQLFDRLLDRLL